MVKPSTVKVKNFRHKLFDLTEQELGLRSQMKRLYDQFVLDVQDDDLALRHVRQAFYQIQKYRVQKKMAELMEFHPFFGANPLSSAMFDGVDEEDDGIV